MNVLPLIHRELLTEARRPFTAIARSLICLVGILAMCWFVIDQNLDHALGPRLFATFNLMTFWLIWLLVPIITADTLSHEKREHTLGLLFLAGLRAGEIVAGKSVAYSFRAFNLVIVTVPFAILPVTLGGVAWEEIALAALTNLASLGLATAAGILASALCRNWWRAVPLAMAMAFGALWLFTAYNFVMHYVVFVGWFNGPAGPSVFNSQFAPIMRWNRDSLIDKFGDQLDLATGTYGPMSPARIGSSWHAELAWGGPAYGLRWVASAALVTLTVLLAATALAWMASMLIERSWRDRPSSTWQLRWRHLWFSPRFWRTHLHRRLKTALAHNPISWLQQYSWEARLQKWGWFLFTATACGVALGEPSGYSYALPVTLRWLAVALLLNIAYVAATSFRREMDNGLMELLLVSPLPYRQLVTGRARGLLGQFQPAVGLLLVVWVAVYFDLPERFYHLRNAFYWGEPIILVGTFAAFVVVGLQQSLRRRSPLLGWAVTLGQGLVLPYVLATGVMLIFIQLRSMPDLNLGFLPTVDKIWQGLFLATQLLVARIAWCRSLRLVEHHESFLPRNTTTLPAVAS